MATIASFSSAMKTQFIGPIRDQLTTNKVLMFGMREKDGKATPDPQGSRPFSGIEADATGIDFVGNTFEMPLRTARNTGVGTRGENATLPLAGRQGYKKITDGLFYQYGVFSITGPLLKASASQKGAYEKALTQEMEGVTDDLKRMVNINAYLSGDGTITTIASGTASATQTVPLTVHLEIGDVYDIYDVTGVTKRNTTPLTILSIDRPNLSVLFDASVTTTTGDRLIRASSDSTTAVPNNDLASGTINGLAKIVNNTGALHGLNPASAGEGFWKSQVIAAGGAVIADTLLRQLVDAIGYESGSDESFVFITTRGIRSRYAQTLQSQKRFNDAQSVTLHGGFKAILFDEDPMVVDDHCQTGRVYALRLKEMFWSQMSDWEWLEEDGHILKQTPRKDAWEATLMKYCNLGTYRRQSHGVITGGADEVR
jgi:hypothetical protein